MQDIEKRLAQQYLSNESKLDKAISNLKNDFGKPTINFSIQTTKYLLRN